MSKPNRTPITITNVNIPGVVMVQSFPGGPAFPSVIVDALVPGVAASPIIALLSTSNAFSITVSSIGSASTGLVLGVLSFSFIFPFFYVLFLRLKNRERRAPYSMPFAA